MQNLIKSAQKILIYQIQADIAKMYSQDGTLNYDTVKWYLEGLAVQLNKTDEELMIEETDNN